MPEDGSFVLTQMAGAMGEHHDGEEPWETAEAVAERLALESASMVSHGLRFES